MRQQQKVETNTYKYIIDQTKTTLLSFDEQDNILQHELIESRRGQLYFNRQPTYQ